MTHRRVSEEHARFQCRRRVGIRSPPFDQRRAPARSVFLSSGTIEMINTPGLSETRRACIRLLRTGARNRVKPCRVRVIVVKFRETPSRVNGKGCWPDEKFRRRVATRAHIVLGGENGRTENQRKHRVAQRRKLGFRRGAGEM